MKVSAERGAAPLRVTFRAKCASPSYRWRFGDGATAQGRIGHAHLPRRPLRADADDGLGRDAGCPRVTSVALTIVAPAQGRLRRDGHAARDA